MQYMLLLFLVVSVRPSSLLESRQRRTVSTAPSGEMAEPDMKFEREPVKATTTTLGSSVTLSCAGTATIGEPTISWLFSNKVNPDVTKWTSRSGGTSGTLILGNLQKSDAGYYFCQLSDPYGYKIISRGALVVVTYLEALFQKFPTSQTITSSRAYISLPCQAPLSNPLATINWYKDETLLKDVMNMFQEYKSKTEYGSLIIFNPKISDSGIYVCEAVNKEANPETRTTLEADIQITVDGSGSYTQKFVADHDIIIDKGKDATLRVGAIGDPSPQYKWTLGISAEVDISSGSRFSVSDNGRELRIKEVEVADRGTYWSQYHNSYNPAGAVSVVRLYVQEDVVFDTVMTAKVVEYSTPETFDCQCSGTPYTDGDPTKAPSALWLRDGKPIVEGNRFKEVDGNLVLSGLKMSESGMYQCFCYNTRQIIQSLMSVHVINTTLPVNIVGKSIAEGVYNKDIDVYCRANGRPLPIVTWYKDIDEINSVYNNRYQITQHNGDDYVLSKLTVISVRAEDAGTLLCRAINYKVSQFTAELLITFTVGNEIAPSISLNDVSIQLNKAIFLNAVAHGYPFPTITWFKDGVQLETRDRYRVDGTHLFIDGTQSSDTGVYLVVAHNGVGSNASANATIKLGTSTAAIIGGVGGAGGCMLILALCILLYVLVRQKQRDNYVPPIDTKTPHEEQIENSISETDTVKKVEQDGNAVISLLPIIHSSPTPPTPPQKLSDVKSWDPDVISERNDADVRVQGTLIARDSDVSGPSTESSKSSSSSSSSSDSDSDSSKRNIVKIKRANRTKKVSPMDVP